MANIVELSEVAQNEIEKSTLWYEGVADGLGQCFVDYVFKAFNSISQNPESYPKKRGEKRVFVMRKFPFVIVYRFLPGKDSIFILHIFHTSRHPKHKYKNK